VAADAPNSCSSISVSAPEPDAEVSHATVPSDWIFGTLPVDFVPDTGTHSPVASTYSMSPSDRRES
jgi:hypothetical protein